jgi:microcystin-dependent protein
MSNFTSGQAWVAGDVVTPTKLLNAVEDAAVVNPAYVEVLAGLLQSYLLPAGAIMPFAMNSVPTNWLACDGAAVSRATYANLFTAIGVVYGAGDGSTTFALPDLRGYFLRGSGTNADGTVGAAFGTKQADAFQGHIHPYSIMNAAGFTFAAGWGGQILGSNTGLPVTDGANGTPRTAAETRPKNIAMLFCIKV